MNNIRFFGILIAVTFSMMLTPALGDTISTDKKIYFTGDIIKISGTFSSYDPNQFVGLRILNPDKSDIISIDQFLLDSTGSFSKSYKAEGTKWSKEGKYTIELVYGQPTEIIIDFKHIPESNVVEKPSTETSQQSENLISEKIKKSKETIINPKILVTGFPDVDKSPQYYFDRYNNEPNFKEWFDSSFPTYTIQEVVGYKPTHIPDFPDSKYSPKYYLNRYISEQKYQSWFDSQFGGHTIYDVLGLPESSFYKVPSWIKNNAKWWSSGLIDDSNFIAGIQYLISEKIIVLDNVSESSKIGNSSIPEWIKNTANWWSEDLIGEDDFLGSLKFLIENGIIRI